MKSFSKSSVFLALATFGAACAEPPPLVEEKYVALSGYPKDLRWLQGESLHLSATWQRPSQDCKEPPTPIEEGIFIDIIDILFGYDEQQKAEYSAAQQERYILCITPEPFTVVNAVGDGCDVQFDQQSSQIGAVPLRTGNVGVSVEIQSDIHDVNRIVLLPLTIERTEVFKAEFKSTEREGGRIAGSPVFVAASLQGSLGTTYQLTDRPHAVQSSAPFVLRQNDGQSELVFYGIGKAATMIELTWTTPDGRALKNVINVPAARAKPRV
jgi:hypothetical protein